MTTTALIDDFSRADQASNGQRWRYFSDRVMGGVSTGTAQHVEVDGRAAVRLTGDVSLENNGGFVQVALDLAPEGRAVDASAFSGIAITLRGDGGPWALNLRTTDLRHPWQSYRYPIHSDAQWQTFHCAFGAFTAQRTEVPLNPARLRRVGIIAIGEARRVDIAVADLRFYACDA